VNNVSYNIRGSYITKEIGRLEVMIIVKIGQTKIMPTGTLFKSFMMI
jgi:hypothetical protein